ncbi:MAG: protein kinase [Anaerolineales bacterium]|nr:protein kinase [Anaerolineales bacterium]
MSLTTGQIINNRYRIVSLLGQGGMGAVYRAWDLNLKMPIALKENLEASQEAQNQFSHEASILAHLSHPNLPRVMDYFSIPDQGQYLVMDFVEGEDLQSMLDRLGVLPETQVLSWVAQICEALEYLHAQNPPIIHRDIKPANIKIRPDGRAMLVDFGIAKIYNASLATTVGAKAVTPGFSPPEQYGGGRTDVRSDIYSLGATLYTLLTGQVLPESVHRAAGSAIPSSPRQINPQVSPMVESVVSRAIEVSSERRYQSARDLHQALTVPVTPTPRPEPVAPTARVEQPIPAAPPVLPQYQEVQPAKKKNKFLPVIVPAALVGICLLCSIVYFNGDSILDRLGSSAADPEMAIIRTNTPRPAVEATQPPTEAPEQPQEREPTPDIPPTTPPEVVVPVVQPTAESPQLPSGPPQLILDKGYNCRGGPSTEYELIWTFEAGKVLEIIGKSDNGWWLVRINDARTRRQQCWVADGQTQGDLSNVPYSSWTGTVDSAKIPWP